MGLRWFLSVLYRCCHPTIYSVVSYNGLKVVFVCSLPLLSSYLHIVMNYFSRNLYSDR